jgi:hypothetical protein
MLMSDGFIHLLDDPWAPHPVVNRHVCNGGGGGGGDGGPEIQAPNAPTAPDYTKYIAEMTRIGGQGQEWAKQFIEEAKSRGVDLMNYAKTVAGKLSGTADTQQANADALQKQWKDLSTPLYEQQQREALRMGADLPAYREQVAGEEEANTAQAIDAQKAAIQRKMLASGTTGGQPGIASQALDTQAAIGRAAAVTASGQIGRRRAGDEAAARTGEALKSEEFIPGVASDQAKLASSNLATSADVQNKGASTAAGLYTPGIQMYGQSIAPMKEWGSAMATDYEDRLKGYGLDINKYSAQNQARQAEQKRADESGGGFMDTILPLAGGIAGSFMGPMGTAAGSAIGKAAGAAAGKGMFGATGGKIPPMGRRVPRYAAGGAIDTGVPHMANGGNFIPDGVSPSGGEEVDDVPAMVSAGEFVIPERTVDWFGEKYFQNLIMKSDKDREKQTVAAPEEVDMNERPPEQALDMQAPMFRSEGARV